MLDLRFDLREALGRGRLDLDHADDRGPEPPGDRGADRALRQAECGLGHGRVDDLGLGDGAEIDVLVGEIALLGEILEGQAVGDALEAASASAALGNTIC